MSRPSPAAGWVDRMLAEELPGLGLLAVEAPAPRGRTGPGTQERLRQLSDRLHGAQAIALRTEPVPQAYRQFFRHVGLDPDTTRTPIEQAVLDRLVHGGYVSRGRLDDAQMLALVETGVPVSALDASAVDGPLGLRPTGDGERLGAGPYASDLPAGRLVVADARAPVAVLFGEVAPGCAPSRDTERLVLFAVQVPGVAAICVEEALWECVNCLEAG
jgi:DNA/RNA-binding domain of Phe-tRNA-synthetase-like protein